MPRNGSGSFSPLTNTAYPAANGVTLTSSDWNAFILDFAAALTASLALDGQSTMAANLPMGGFRITGMAAATGATDAVNANDLQTGRLVTFTTAGTSTAYTLTPVPAISAYAAGLSFIVNFNAVCGAAPTLAISGVATPPNLVKQMVDGTYSNIAAGDITLNHRSRVTLISATQALVETLPIPESARTLKIGTISSDITLTAAHNGGFYRHTDASVRNVAIPANATDPLPIGYTYSGSNKNGSGGMTVSITSDTLEDQATGATGTRTIAAKGEFTLIKETATFWSIRGSGIT